MHYRLLNLMEANFVETNPAPVKSAMAMMGLIEEHLRLPLVPISEKSRTRIQLALLDLGLIFEAGHVIA